MNMNQRKTIDNEKFKKFFFYGIENKKEAKEGILYFSANQVYQKHANEDWYAIPNEQFENEIIQEASRKYKQFYRFITLNDISNSYTFDVNMKDLKRELEKEMQILREEKKIIDTKAGVFFIKSRETELKGGQYYVYGEGLKGEVGWTKEVYDILEKLEMMEQEDKIGYQQYWLLTKLARAMNRFDGEEALRVRNTYEKLKESQEKENEREECL